ncbi:MAG: type III-B CRISPR module RAMP protein Cmr4 [Bacteroidota bacterium]|nr:type III-B CRISPR module RAMP protein Cmr4 [Bacteroidota bacterium]
MKNKSEIFTITAQTNLHAGSGDTRYGIIDNLVQRDSISELPVINASSLKGALRQFTRFQSKKGKILKDEEYKIFGSPAKPEKDDPEHQAGSYNFLTAKLLVLPVRSSQKHFFRAISLSVLQSFVEDADYNGALIPDDFKTALEALKNLGIEKKKPIIFENLKGLLLEDFEMREDSQIIKDFAHKAVLEKYLGGKIVVFHDDDFTELCEDLPVIARNYLENGESKNLWYEQVVPRQSMFYYTVIRPVNNTFNDVFAELLEKYPVQIGANATIGYGLCKISKL